MPQGIFITVTHTGVTSSAIFLADIYPTTDGHTAFNRAGPVYVPVSGSIVLTYSDTVALSFESGNIRKFVDAGYLTATLSLAGAAVTFPPATGDASGTYPNLTVTGIQGFSIQNGAGPANGDALLYNSLTNQWEHSPIIFGGGPPVGPAGGDLGGLYPNPGVTGLQTDPLPVAVAGGFLKRDAANTGWEEVIYGTGANTVCVGNDARLSDSRTPTGAAGGDLTGTYPNPTIALLAVTDAKVAVANKDGLAAVASMRTLGTGAQQACAGNDARLSDSRAPTGAAGGDLTGTYPNPTLSAVGAAGVKGSASSVPVFTTDSKGRVTANTDTAIQIAETQVTGLVGDLGNKADKVTTLSAGSGLTGGGDLSANRTISMPNVGTAGVYGSVTQVPVITTDAQGRVSAVTNTTISGVSPGGAAGGDLTGTYPNPTIAALAVTDAKVAVANKDGLAAVASMRTLGTGATQACAGNDARLSDSRAPTGAAGGDLTGTYPNPTLAAVGAAGTYGSSTSIPVLTTDTKGRVTGVVNTPITTLGVGAFPRLGNTVLVDGVNGNDLTGTVNGLPVATVEQGVALALAAAPTPVTVWIAPGTYTLASATTGLTVPDGCALRGLSVQTTRIVMNAANPGSTVTLLTMGENTRVEDLSLTLNSSNATTNLVGIATPGTTSNTSKLRTAVLTVNNAGLAVGTTTNVYGILDAGTGTLGPATFSFNFTRGVTINVLSNGGGAKRGLLVTGADDITFRDTNIYVAAPTDPASTGSYHGVETTNVDSDAEFRTCSISGPSTAGGYTGSDILQTAPTIGVITNKGIQLGPGCDLINKTAGGKPFTTYVTPTTLIYGLQGNAQNATHYLWPGVQLNSDNTEIFYRFQQKAIVQGMSINMRTAPGAGKSLILTVRKSSTSVPGSGVATVMTATVSDLNTTGFQYGVSVDFAQGEYLSLQIVGGAGVTAADITVELDIF